MNHIQIRNYLLKFSDNDDNLLDDIKEDSTTFDEQDKYINDEKYSDDANK